MGSGAFLVAACRYLADRLVEAWLDEGDAEALAMDLHRTAGRVGADAEADQLLLKARREITEHCLYGVDINPLAVEMAKLSLWLITMDTERPFGFLDDRLAAGDSLLGLVSLEQLESLHVDAKEGRRLHHGTLDFASEWRDKLAQAADLRRKITATGGVTIRDIEHKARLLAQAEKLSGEITTVADAITATGLANAKLKGKKLDQAFLELYVSVSNEDTRSWPRTSRRTSRTRAQQARSNANPSTGRWCSPRSSPTRRTQASTPSSATRRSWAVRRSQAPTATTTWTGCNAGTATTSRAAPTSRPRFVLRADRLLSTTRSTRLRHDQHAHRRRTLCGSVLEQVPVSPSAPDARRIRGQRRARTCRSLNSGQVMHRCPGTAAYWLDGEEVPAIGPDLQPYGRIQGPPVPPARERRSSHSSARYVLGLGFTLSHEQKDELIARDPRNARGHPALRDRQGSEPAARLLGQPMDHQLPRLVA